MAIERIYLHNPLPVRNEDESILEASRLIAFGPPIYAVRRKILPVTANPHIVTPPRIEMLASTFEMNIYIDGDGVVSKYLLRDKNDKPCRQNLVSQVHISERNTLFTFVKDVGVDESETFIYGMLAYKKGPSPA